MSLISYSKLYAQFCAKQDCRSTFSRLTSLLRSRQRQQAYPPLPIRLSSISSTSPKLQWNDPYKKPSVWRGRNSCSSKCCSDCGIFEPNSYFHHDDFQNFVSTYFWVRRERLWLRAPLDLHANQMRRRTLLRVLRSRDSAESLPCQDEGLAQVGLNLRLLWL